jgi:hypothetical protein
MFGLGTSVQLDPSQWATIVPVVVEKSGMPPAR